MRRRSQLLERFTLPRRAVRASFTLAMLLILGGALAQAGPMSARRDAHVGSARTDAKRGKIWTWDFAADTLGKAPATSVSMGGVWTVIEDSTVVGDSTVTTKRTLRQAESDDGVAFHYIRFKRPLLEDVVASVRFRIVSGEIDPSAGLVFQLDPKGTSGYLVKVNARSGDLAFYYLLYGKRRSVRFAKIDPPAPGEWHTLAIHRQGSILRASYDGTERMMVRDERYGKGTLGLWTDDDTVADFEDLSAGVP